MIGKDTIINCVELISIIFQADDSGWLSGRFLDMDTGQSFVAVGTMLNPEIGMGYKLIGNIEMHPVYGEQFKFDQYQTLQPVSERGVYIYITQNCKFVGAEIGNTIIQLYQKDALDVMRNDPERLAGDIKGITIERAKEIQESLKENERMEKLSIEVGEFLDVPGMHKNLVGRVIAKYDCNALAVIQKNPYILTQFSYIGFPLADKVAIKNGYDPKGIERKKALAKYCLQEAMQESGSTWIAEVGLLRRMKELVTGDKLIDGLYALAKEQVLCSTESVHNNINRVFWAFKRYYEYEQYIARKIGELRCLTTR